ANKITFSEMVNAAGKTVKADAASLQSAMADYGDAFSDKLTIDMINNGKGDASWPIAGYTYLVIYMDQQPDSSYGCIKPAKLLNFVHWALTDAGAASRAAALGYATLPETVRAKVFAKLKQVTCAGQPLESEITMLQ